MVRLYTCFGEKILAETRAIQIGSAALLAGLLFTLFPYITPARIFPSDTQPYWVLVTVGFLALVMHRLQLPKGIWLVVFMLPAAIPIYLLGEITLPATRDFANYVGLSATAVIGYLAFGLKHETAKRILYAAMIVWILAGLIQLVAGKEALCWALSDCRTSETRGVVGLAPEPTFYASCIFFMMLMGVPHKMKRSFYAMGLAGIVFLAQSTQIVLILMAVASLYALLGWTSKEHRRQSVLVALAGIVTMVLFLTFYSDSRLAELFEIVIKEPGTMLFVDASANIRFASIFVSFYGSISDGLMPHGFTTFAWVSTFENVKSQFPDLLWYATAHERIESGMGALLFQMGVLSLPFFWGILALLKSWDTRLMTKFLWGVGFGLIFLSAIPLGFPMSGLAIGSIGAAGGYGRPKPAGGHVETGP